MQETWAIHGVYPSMAWTPDSRSVVLWAGGKIHRVERETGAESVIPFRVRGAQAGGGRPISGHGRLRALPGEGASVGRGSPKGDQVVYEALGHVWVREMKGAARRLTRQNDHFELYPSFSRNGRSIVYVTSDDEDGGTVRVAPTRGGKGRVVTDRPGTYREPTFSPDGSRIVYRKDMGASC
jgi:hypothetical protein